MCDVSSYKQHYAFHNEKFIIDALVDVKGEHYSYALNR